jgi:formiminotetrahydrofolate cyclodeaminase
VSESIEQFLDEAARRGSWIGGGSLAALSAAQAAALLEKLTTAPQTARRLRRIRRTCVGLIRRDAETFAQVINATRTKNRRAFQRSLGAATEVQVKVFVNSRAIERACRRASRFITPRLQSDLRCALAFAAAAKASASALIRTNLAWLNHPASAARVRRRLRS